MKKRIIAALLIVVPYLAFANTEPTVQFFPYGFWPICEVTGETGGPFCSVPRGEETFVLIATATDPHTTEFWYSVSGVTREGEYRSFTVFLGCQDGYGEVVLPTGVILDPVITVQEIPTRKHKTSQSR